MMVDEIDERFSAWEFLQVFPSALNDQYGRRIVVVGRQIDKVSSGAASHMGR